MRVALRAVNPSVERSSQSFKRASPALGLQPKQLGQLLYTALHANPVEIRLNGVECHTEQVTHNLNGAEALDHRGNHYARLRFVMRFAGLPLASNGQLRPQERQFNRRKTVGVNVKLTQRPSLAQLK